MNSYTIFNWQLLMVILGDVVAFARTFFLFLRLIVSPKSVNVLVKLPIKDATTASSANSMSLIIVVLLSFYRLNDRF